MKGQPFQQELREVNGLNVKVTTYKVGNEFHCQVTDSEPGATIARSKADTANDAVNSAISKASRRIIIKGKSI